MTRTRFGQVVALLAAAAGAAHERLDRAARRLANRPDAVDQHHAQARDAIATTGGVHIVDPVRGTPSALDRLDPTGRAAR